MSIIMCVRLDNKIYQIFITIKKVLKARRNNGKKLRRSIYLQLHIPLELVDLYYMLQLEEKYNMV